MSYVGSEIITLQFGHYSNFIGSHWWNLQEAGFEYVPDTPSEVNHDVLFREGQTLRGEVTFTPRLLLVDLKGSLGALPEGGRLYGLPPEPHPTLSLWPADKVTKPPNNSTQDTQEPSVNGTVYANDINIKISGKSIGDIEVALQTEPANSKNEFQQDLEKGESSAASLPDGLKEAGRAVPKLYDLDSVKSWSDYLRPHLHPRSVNVVREYRHGDESQPFQTYMQGQTAWERGPFNDEFTDRLRLYLEETDNLQGFQVLIDTWDGFSGLGCAALQFLRDQYPSKTVFAVACRPAPAPERKPAQLVNQSLAFAALSEHSGLFVPVGAGGLPEMPHVRYNFRFDSL